MKMVKLIQSVLVALLAVTLGACGTVQKAIHEATAPAPQASQPAQSVAAKPVATPAPAPQQTAPVMRAEVGQFPTSKQKPVGKPWTVMHKDGFTGSVDDACKLLGLTTAQCTTYKTKRSAGQCVAMQLPNGVVLDGLTFTREGKHQVQRNVKVDLKNPLSREAMVCDIGNGISVHQYIGCGNFGVVHNWTKPKEVVTSTPTPAPVVDQCVERIAQVNIWDKKAFDIAGVSKAIATARSRSDGQGHYAPDRLSRGFGAILRGENAKGNLPRSATAHATRAKIVKSDGSSFDVFQGDISGGVRQFQLRNFEEGDIFLVSFADISKLVSPVSELRSKYSEFVGGCRVNHLHAIEK